MDPFVVLLTPSTKSIVQPGRSVENVTVATSVVRSLIFM